MSEYAYTVPSDERVTVALLAVIPQNLPAKWDPTVRAAYLAGHASGHQSGHTAGRQATTADHEAVASAAYAEGHKQARLTFAPERDGVTIHSADGSTRFLADDADRDADVAHWTNGTAAQARTTAARLAHWSAVFARRADALDLEARIRVLTDATRSLDAAGIPRDALPHLSTTPTKEPHQ